MYPKRHRELVKMSDLFTRYKDTLKAPQQSVIQEAVIAIEEVTGYKLQARQCSYTVSTRTLSLNVPAALKQEIKTHHEAVMVRLRERLGEQSVPKLVL